MNEKDKFRSPLRRRACDVDVGCAVYTFRDRQTGESCDVTVCQAHGEQMPLIDGDRVTAIPAEAGVRCEFFND